jgi:hypothetical protein
MRAAAEVHATELGSGSSDSRIEFHVAARQAISLRSTTVCFRLEFRLLAPAATAWKMCGVVERAQLNMKQIGVRQGANIIQQSSENKSVQSNFFPLQNIRIRFMTAS